MSYKKIIYLLDSFTRYYSEKKCPFCDSKSVLIDDRKYFFTRLFKCKNCYLKFRHPKDSLKSNYKFYNNFYEESDGITTSLPENDTLKGMLSSNFKGTSKDASRYISLFKTLKPSGRIRILDFGCNWGYTSYQFIAAGFEVVSYEIAENRRNFGNENLGLSIISDISKINGNFDFIFSSHVIEHLPNVNVLFNLASKYKNNNSFLVTFCPNASEFYKKTDFSGYHKCWGQVHPNYISELFFINYFKNNPYYIGSGDNLNNVKNWNCKSQIVTDMSQWELFSIIKL